MNERTRQDAQSTRLDHLLRDWHEVSRDRAISRREGMLRAARDLHGSAGAVTAGMASQDHVELRTWRIGPVIPWRIAAAIGILAGLAVILLPQPAREARAEVLMLPEGGRLEAFDQDGNVMGPCALTHTDVEIEVSGLFARTTVRQQYHNPYDAKIEAMYTFPLPHESAVDRMRMVIDEDRIVEGEVRERQEARQIYESARDAGHVAALLEQERPNIFTQQVANIEPGAEIEVEISYIEMVEQRDGEFTLAFPMTVAPRYIPGYALGGTGSQPVRQSAALPQGLSPRQGLILRGPATFERTQIRVDYDEHGERIPQFGAIATTSLGPLPQIQRIIDAATPIMDAGLGEWRIRPENQERFHRLPDVSFFVHYAGEEGAELGQLSGDGVGHIAGRWFWFDPAILTNLGWIDGGGDSSAAAARDLGAGPGSPFAGGSDQVPDASRITPMPVHPSTRAGHNISVRVIIDSGGPALTSIDSELHEIEVDRSDGNEGVIIELKNDGEIPNRDFVLKWKLDDAAIQESTFVHAADDFEQNGGYFTLILAPPARVEAADVVPRELVFVLDTSGSMSGEPIAKAKSVLTSAIDAMREGDTFNIITFAGHTDILWDEPRPNTDANRAEALAWINSQQGQGGTEMMTAIEAALNPLHPAVGEASDLPELPLTLEALSNLPADGREVRVRFRRDAIRPGDAWSKTAWGSLHLRDDLAIDWTAFSGAIVPLMDDESVDELMGRGTWSTRDGRRYFDMHGVEAVSSQPTTFGGGAPMRLCIFLTDGEVGNDMAIIDAVKKYAATTRVFAFGVGNSVNRYLLANMAHAGRGEVEFVTQETERKDVVERFVKRIESPVLTDIELDVSKDLVVSDILPLTPGGFVPDLYDVQPLIIHGRYTQAGKGTLTVRGRTGNGPYERTVALDLPARSEGHDVIRTLWARNKVDELTNADLTGVQLGQMAPEQRQSIVDLAVRHQIMSQFTSFVAVEKSRVTVDGKPMLVRVPIELPSDARWEGFFGSDGCIDAAAIDKAVKELSRLNVTESAFSKQAVSNANPGYKIETTGPFGDFDVAMAEAAELLDQDQFSGAQNAVLTANIRLMGVKDSLPADQFERRMERAQDLMIQIAQAEENTMRSEASRMQHELRSQQSAEPAEAAKAREEQIYQLLLQVRDSQIERNYDDALQTIDHILFLEEGNEVALALRDAIQTAGQWKHMSNPMNAEDREFSYSWQNQDNRRARIGEEVLEFTGAAGGGGLVGGGASEFSEKIVIPRGISQSGGTILNLNTAPAEVLGAMRYRADFGPGARSTTGLMPYPDDWPSLSIKRTSVGSVAYQLGDSFDQNGRLKVPLVQQDSFNLVELLGGFGSDSFAGTILPNDPAVPANKADQRVAVALQTILPTVEFQNNRLKQVLEFLQTVSSVNLQADWPALARIGVQPNAPIELAMKQVSVEAVLDSVLGQLGKGEEAVGWRIMDGLVVIGPVSLLDKVVCIYDFRDLIDSSARKEAPEASGEAELDQLRQAISQELVQLIQNYIDPGGWNEGDLEIHSGVLTVRTSTRNQVNVAGLLTQLWEIRSPIDSTTAEPASQVETTGLEALAQAIIGLREFLGSNDSGDTDQASPQSAAALALVFDPNDPAHHPFYIERCAIAVDKLVQAGHLDEAQMLAGWIIAVLDPAAQGPGDPCHRDLVAALRSFAGEDHVSKNLNPGAVDDKLAPAIAAAAQRAMVAQLERAIIGDTLRIRLDDDLFAMWIASHEEAINAPGDTASDAAPSNEATARERVLATILTAENPRDEVLDQLRGAGVEVESKAGRMNIVVGRFEIENLERIAMLPCVRRVERTE